ncbi:MAG: response regulator, partial [Gammaproteobacteria bacterium]|nr:response regulator [Gammaproteobacteria bacterium]
MSLPSTTARTCGLPIIMLTGHAEAERVREARDAGVNGFLAKPVTGEAVHRHIVSLLEDTRPF